MELAQKLGVYAVYNNFTLAAEARPCAITRTYWPPLNFRDEIGIPIVYPIVPQLVPS